jgi:hypothetical protein
MADNAGEHQRILLHFWRVGRGDGHERSSNKVKYLSRVLTYEQSFMYLNKEKTSLTSICLSNVLFLGGQEGLVLLHSVTHARLKKFLSFKFTRFVYKDHVKLLRTIQSS